MTSAQDSSVLFALDELRSHERERCALKRKRAQELADVARRQAEAASQAREKARCDAEEVLRLRRAVAEKERSLAGLEAELSATAQHRQTLQARLLQHESSPPSAPLRPASAKLPHLLWAACLLLCCAMAYLLATGGTQEAPMQSPLVLVEPADCPAPTLEPRPASTSKPAPGAISQPEAEPKRTKPNAQPPRPPKKEEGGQIHIDGDCDGPLCGMPQ